MKNLLIALLLFFTAIASATTIVGGNIEISSSSIVENCEQNFSGVAKTKHPQITGLQIVLSDSDLGQCMGECASEQGICIGQCQGDGLCIAHCAAAHGRCVARCN